MPSPNAGVGGGRVRESSAGSEACDSHNTLASVPLGIQRREATSGALPLDQLIRINIDDDPAFAGGEISEGLVH